MKMLRNAGCLVGIGLAIGVADLAHAGPYAPAAGQTGSTAIRKDDSQITAWATGHVNYVVGSNVDATWQTPTKAYGPAEGTSLDIVSLGRGGQITLIFANPIKNGVGADFAVFENSFIDTFLELAWVEISSNGTNFFRFAHDSLTGSTVGSFGVVDPTNIHNLAGKYKQGFGTPFDLGELAGVSALLNVNAVTHVKLLDIIGDGSALDITGEVIYDPYPTSGSAGFDLDAIGVIHQTPEPTSIALLIGGSMLLLRRARKSL